MPRWLFFAPILEILGIGASAQCSRHQKNLAIRFILSQYDRYGYDLENNMARESAPHCQLQ